MFNWICPECGRDVPPSATECRFCAERKKAAETASGGVAVAPPPAVDPAPAYSVPPPAQPIPQPPPQTQQPQYTQQYAPPQPQYAPPQQPYYPPAPQPPYYQPQQPGYPPAKAALPTWAMAIMFGLGFIVL